MIPMCKFRVKNGIERIEFCFLLLGLILNSSMLSGYFQKGNNHILVKLSFLSIITFCFLLYIVIWSKITLSRLFYSYFATPFIINIQFYHFRRVPTFPFFSDKLSHVWL